MRANSIKLVVALITSSAVSAYAASAGVGGEGSGLLIWALIGFAVLVVMLQAVPAVIMLVAMMKGLFASADKPVAVPKP
jgi:hypothetical protein